MYDHVGLYLCCIYGSDVCGVYMAYLYGYYKLSILLAIFMACIHGRDTSATSNILEGHINSASTFTMLWDIMDHTFVWRN